MIDPPKSDLQVLVEAARRAPGLADPRRAANRAKIAARIAAAPAPTAGKLAAAALGSKLKLAIAIAGLGAGALGVGLITRPREPHQVVFTAGSAMPIEPSAAAPPRVPPEPEMAVENAIAAPAPSAIAAPTPTPIERLPRASSNASAHTNNTNTDSDFDGDVRLLHGVNAALRDGDGDKALRLLDARRGVRGDGTLDEERAAARIVTLCQLGRGADAARETTAFTALHKTSPMLARIHAACDAAPR